MLIKPSVFKLQINYPANLIHQQLHLPMLITHRNSKSTPRAVLHTHSEEVSLQQFLDSRREDATGENSLEVAEEREELRVLAFSFAAIDKWEFELD